MDMCKIDRENEKIEGEIFIWGRKLNRERGEKFTCSRENEIKR